MATRQIVPMMCPVCGGRFTAPIESIIDVSHDAKLKTRFLKGQANIATCPQCGDQGPKNAPALYHDAEHELALVLMPPELNLENDDQQKIIGDMTNTLLNNLPPDQRKGYLLTPQIFFTMQTLVGRVLEAEGVTPEMQEEQQAKAQLVQEFLQVKDEKALRALVKEHDPELDYEFFQILTALAQAANEDGRPDAARALLGLRSTLAEWSTGGREAIAEVNAAMGLGETITREDLLNRLQAAQSDEEWEELVAAGRPLLDYAFFQHLTAQIEAAPDADGAAELKSLRSRILDTTARQDEKTRAAMKEAADLLTTILQSEDPQAAIRQNSEQINSAFLMVLTANMQQAQTENREDLGQRLQQVYDAAAAIIQEQLPPEIQLLDQLMRAPYPEGTQQLPTENREIITPEFLDVMDHLIAEVDPNRQSEAAKHLTQVQEQAKTIAEGVARP